MFGTLHWNPHSKEAEFIERPHGSSNLEKNPACDRCRARKVKCRNPENEACTRCKRLGKTCTFSPGRHRQRGEHRVQVQRQHSLQKTSSSVSVSVSSSSKGTDKETVKEPASAPPGTADNDSERGRGQQSLDDIPASFDLSFLADFDHETSDREEDTSFAFFSTIFPSTHAHPEPEPQPEPQLATSMPMPMPISTTLLSPPLSSEDEIQRYLPPANHQSQDPSLFDIYLATPPSTAFPPGAGAGAGGCQCLPAVIFAVEEFEAACTAGHRAELDSITAYQKEVIRRCRSQLKCSGCMARRETLVLLVFMLEKIVAACGRIVALYRVKDARVQMQMQMQLPTPSSDSVLLGRDGDGEDEGEGDMDRGLALAACGAAAATSDWRELLLGDYEISSALEWEHLVRVLIFLQLRAVMELLADVKSIGGEVLGEALGASLVQAEIRLGELEKDILIL